MIITIPPRYTHFSDFGRMLTAHTKTNLTAYDFMRSTYSNTIKCRLDYSLTHTHFLYPPIVIGNMVSKSKTTMLGFSKLPKMFID